MPSFVIDSSVYIALLYKNDVFHLETQDFFRKAEGILEQSQFFLPNIVLFEMSHFFRFKGPMVFKTYLDFQKKLFDDLRFTIYALDLEFLLAFQNLPRQEMPFLKTGDAIIAFTAFIHKSILLSWDKDLLKKAGKFTETYTPTEFLNKFPPNGI